MSAGRWPSMEALRRYAALLGLPASERLLQILALLFETEQERRLLAALPATAAEAAADEATADEAAADESSADEAPATEASADEATADEATADEATLRRLEARGAITVTPGPPVVYRPFPYLFQLRDASITAPGATDRLLALWQELLDVELPGLIDELGRQRLPALVEVHPATAALPPGSPPSRIEALVEGAEVIAAVPCACRTQAHRAGRSPGCPAPGVDLCLQTGEHARVALRRGVGETISREEARRRLALAAEAGLVHTLSRNPRTGMDICNCCPCCCAVLQMVNRLGYPERLAASGHRAEVDPASCAECGTCVARCPFGCVRVAGEVDAERCFGCGCCVLACPQGAIALAARREPWKRRR